MENGLGPLWEKLKHIKKDYILIGLLVGVLLLVIAIPTKEKSSTPIVTETGQTDNAQGSETKNAVEVLEQRLVGTLGKVDGVGKVEVMLTQKSSGEKVVEKDTPITDISTDEKDSTGGVRTSRESTSGEATVYEKDENGNQVPYVVKELEPEIFGVLVVAEGGGDPVVVNNITDAVMSLFGIEAHKIKVMKMN